MLQLLRSTGLTYEVREWLLRGSVFIDVEKLWGGDGGWVHLDYNVSSGMELSLRSPY